MSYYMTVMGIVSNCQGMSCIVIVWSCVPYFKFHSIGINVDILEWIYAHLCPILAYNSQMNTNNIFICNTSAV